MDEQNKKLDDKQLDEITSIVYQMMDGVTTYADVRGISEDQLEAVYNVGFVNYQAGKFDEAEKVFRFLTLVSHTSPKYWTALGSVHQAKRNYGEAFKTYAAAALLDAHRPRPHYYAAECALAVGDLDSAESGARSVLGLCPAGTVENDEFRAKAEKLLAKVEEARKRGAASAPAAQS